MWGAATGYFWQIPSWTGGGVMEGVDFIFPTELLVIFVNTCIYDQGVYKGFFVTFTKKARIWPKTTKNVNFENIFSQKLVENLNLPKNHQNTP